MPTLFRRIQRGIPLEVTSAGRSEVWFVQFRSAEPGAWIRLGFILGQVVLTDASLRGADRFELCTTDDYIELRVVSGDDLWAFSFSDGVLVLNRP